MQLPKAADRLAPPEALFDQLPFDLADIVARMSRGPIIDSALRSGGVNVLRDVRRGVAGANAVDERGPAGRAATKK